MASAVRNSDCSSREYPGGIVHQESRVDAEKTCKQFARSVGHVRARAAFDLRKVRLAEAAAEFLFHGRDYFGLGHGAVKPRSEPSMKRRERSLSPRVMGVGLSSIAICKMYIAICNLSREIGVRL